MDKNTKNYEWVEKAKKIHPNYLYDHVNYINNITAIEIGCIKHGYFKITPKNFIKKEYECAKCKKENNNNEKWKNSIKKLKEKYPLYDFSETIYNGVKNPMIVKCLKHGYFTTTLYKLNKGVRCKKCYYEINGENKRIKFNEFVERAQKIFGDKYSYNEELFRINNTENAIIKCPIHGEFIKNIKLHLQGQGCQKCSGVYDIEEKKKMFIETVKKIHPELDFSETVYNKTHEKVKVKCHKLFDFGEEHGEFLITPHSLYEGYGCPKCSETYMDKDLFIKKSKYNFNGDFYDYSKVNYINNTSKVEIICPVHGSFFQKPILHLRGQGCPSCNRSHLENEVDLILKRNLKCLYINQYRNKELFDRQSLDFYIPSLKIAIECQGEQHFNNNFFKKFGLEYSEEKLKYRIELDKNKRNICLNNDIKLIYYLNKKFVKYLDNNVLYATNEEELLKLIKTL